MHNPTAFNLFIKRGAITRTTRGITAANGSCMALECISVCVLDGGCVSAKGGGCVSTKGGGCVSIKGASTGVEAISSMFGTSLSSDHSTLTELEYH